MAAKRKRRKEYEDKKRFGKKLIKDFEERKV